MCNYIYIYIYIYICVHGRHTIRTTNKFFWRKTSHESLTDPELPRKAQSTTPEKTRISGYNNNQREANGKAENNRMPAWSRSVTITQVEKTRGKAENNRMPAWSKSVATKQLKDKINEIVQK